MYCSKCGKENLNDATYCGGCGEKIDGASGVAKEVGAGVAKLEKKSGEVEMGTSKKLQVIEVVLWLGVVLGLVNLFSNTSVVLAVGFSEVTLILSIGYIRGWHRYFGALMGLILAMTLVNIFYLTYTMLALIDILIYVFAFGGVYLKSKERL